MCSEGPRGSGNNRSLNGLLEHTVLMIITRLYVVIKDNNDNKKHDIRQVVADFLRSYSESIEKFLNENIQ